MMRSYHKLLVAFTSVWVAGTSAVPPSTPSRDAMTNVRAGAAMTRVNRDVGPSTASVVNEYSLREGFKKSSSVN